MPLHLTPPVQDCRMVRKVCKLVPETASYRSSATEDNLTSSFINITKTKTDFAGIYKLTAFTADAFSTSYVGVKMDFSVDYMRIYHNIVSEERPFKSCR